MRREEVKREYAPLVTKSAKGICYFPLLLRIFVTKFFTSSRTTFLRFTISSIFNQILIDKDISHAYLFLASGDAN